MRRCKKFFTVTILILFALTLHGCGDEPDTTKPEVKKAQKVQASAPKPAPTLVEDVKPAEDTFVYNAEGRRDPFEVLVKIKKSLAQAEIPLTPLQKFDVGQLKLVGLIIGKGEPTAMVKAPDGKAYILRRGVKVGKNSGKVTEINSNGVVVEEKYIDFSGAARQNLREIQLPKREGV